MRKIKAICFVVLISMLIIFLSTGVTLAAIADTGEEPPAVTEVVEDTADDNGQTITEQFTEYLKAKYGEDYEYYYNRIIEEWGSVEAYLLSFGKKLPEEYKTSWDYFVEWLGEYSPVWAPIFAVVIVILVAVIGKKKFDALVKNVVDKKIAPVIAELNKQSKSLATIAEANKALLPKNEKFADISSSLDNSAKELNNG